MTGRIKFLIALGSAIRNGAVKTIKQATAFAEQQFGKIDKNFVDDIVNVFKKEGKTKKGEVVPIKKKIDLSKYDDDALNALVAEDEKLLAEADKLSEAGENYGSVKAIKVRRKEIKEILEAAQNVPKKEGIMATDVDKKFKKTMDDVIERENRDIVKK